MLFGVAGCGKSSIINLLADKLVADVSADVAPCTRSPRWYPISLGGKRFRLWDTMGFNPPEVKGINPLSPYEQAYSVLREGGVDLILLCSRKDRMSASLRNLYWLLETFFFCQKAKVALVLTYFDASDDEWWDKNMNSITQKCTIPAQSIPHACITTTRDESTCMYNKSKEAMKELLQKHGTTQHPTPLHLDLSSDSTRAEAVEHLKIHCQLSRSDATTLVKEFSKRPFRAVLFGKTGAGMSSIINLMVGSKVAEVAKGIKSCTLGCRPYVVDTGSHKFQVWDTVGLDGTYSIDAVPKIIVNLIRDLQSQGGIDLLVFCKEGPTLKVEPKVLIAFRFLREFLCKSQIPVGFIITHLEEVNSMETWWKVNGEKLLDDLGVETHAVTGHACLMALPENQDGQMSQDKLSLPRQSILAILEDSITYGSGAFEEVARGRDLPEQKWITVRNIKNRCQVGEQEAEKLAKYLQPSKG